MNKQEYIEKAKNTILNRVRFHAPVVYDDKIDKTVLFVNGIDIKKPIFKFEKELNKKLVRAFELAQQEEQFNLLIPTSSLGKVKEKVLNTLPNTIMYSPQNSSVSFVEMVNKLNINYQSSSNYNLVFKDKFFKINDQILNPNFKEFVLKQTLCFDGVFVDYSEFVLNGNNFFVKFSNKVHTSKKMSVEFNLPLKKGYYYFKKQNKHVVIENLLTKEKFYLNFVCRNCKFSFSCVDGLENSVYSCINIKLNFSVNSNQDKFVFFNVGESQFCLQSLCQVEKFLNLAIKKSCEIFNVHVKTKNPRFDLFFNKTLPQKIWINWINNEINPNLEEKYVSLKKLFVRGEKNFSFVHFKEIGLKEIDVFNGEYYKKILIIRGKDKFLRVGKTFFYNINGISNFSLKNKEPIVLSFGD